MAQEASNLALDVAKTDFLAQMSHELRTPIYGVMGMTELALSEELSPPVREYLLAAQTSAAILLERVNEMLEYSVLEARNFALHGVIFDLRHLVSGVVHSLKATAQARALKVTCEVASNVPRWLVGDELCLRQLIISLLNAAIKSTDQGRVTLNLGAEEISAGQVTLRIEMLVSGDHVRLARSRMTNAGNAIAQQGSTAGTQGTNHAVTGFSVAQGLVHVMGGQMHWVHRAGGGRALSLRIVLGLANPDLAAAQVAKEPRSIADSRALAKLPAAALLEQRALRILLAEDTIANQKIVTAILNKRGHEVAIARNGHEVVELLKAGEQYDVILMDLEMPSMGGMEATAHVRGQESAGARRVPIVAITAHAMPGDRQRCLEAGMDAYLSKPISSQDLIETVEYLALTNAAAPIPASSAGHSGASQGKSSVFEPENVLKRLGDDQRILDTLIEFFLEDYPALLERLQDALRINDAAEATLAAHSLKGLAANFNAHAAVAAAATLEKAGQDQDLASVAEGLPMLTSEFIQLAQSLEDYRRAK